jgi:hypothetical protein
VLFNPEDGEQGGVTRVQRSFRFALAAWALLDSWMCRFQMNPDGVSYLDMGDQYWKGNWHAALNSQWPPLYGWLTGLMFRVTKPSMRWEYPEVHLLNLAIFLATLFCFEFFWRELLSSRGDKSRELVSGGYSWILGYLLFACLIFGPGALLTSARPDLLVAAQVLLASGAMLQFQAGRLNGASAGLLGALLGTGYLAKAAMLPFAVVVMMTMLAVGWRHQRRRSLIVLTVLGFLVVSIPYVWALSRNEHRLTFGDSAGLNQGLWVNGAKPLFRHWQGDGAGRALHPTRRVFDFPEVYEFATPVEGTYPVWYDPTYWYAGLDSSVHPAQEFKALLRNTANIELCFLRIEGFLTTVVLMMFLLGDRLKDSWRRLMSFWPILVPAVATFLMYAMVHWEERYTIGAMLVVFGAAMAATGFSGAGRSVYVLRAASLTLGLIVVCWVLPLSMLNGFLDGLNSARQVVVAERLRTMGIEPGDHVAMIGDGFNEYWARLDKVRIVAEAPNLDTDKTGDSPKEFWDSSPEIELRVLNILKSAGAKAVIAATPPKGLTPGWMQIGDTGYAVYFFR